MSVASEARHRLRSRLFHAVREVSVEVEGSAIVLRGQLATFHQKQLAQEAVKQIDGILSITNQIEVVSVA